MVNRVLPVKEKTHCEEEGTLIVPGTVYSVGGHFIFVYYSK